jgi:hypothetical protein
MKKKKAWFIHAAVFHSVPAAAAKSVDALRPHSTILQTDP